MRSRYAGRPFTTSTRRDRGRAGGCQHPHAAAFARPYHRRPPIHPRLQADGHLPQRGAGVHVGGGQGPGPRRGADGDHRVPRPRLPRAGAAEPGTHQGNDGLGGLRARSRRLPRVGLRGAGPRGRRPPPPGRPAHRTHGRPPGPRRRMRRIGHPGGNPAETSQHRLHHRGEESWTGRNMVGEQLSRGPRGCREPFLLLQLRTQQRLDAFLRRAVRAARLLHQGDRQARLGRTHPVEHRGARGRME